MAHSSAVMSAAAAAAITTATASSANLDSSAAIIVLTVSKHKVSSVLNKSAEFASKHMFDGLEDTCWNSHQGSPQFILLEFEALVIPTSITLLFQGGFVGQDAVIELLGSGSASPAGGGDVLLRDLWESLEDNNTAQTKTFNEDSRICTKFLKITFPTSTDFYGRVTIYKLIVRGYSS